MSQDDQKSPTVVDVATSMELQERKAERARQKPTLVPSMPKPDPPLGISQPVANFLDNRIKDLRSRLNNVSERLREGRALAMERGKAKDAFDKNR